MLIIWSDSNWTKPPLSLNLLPILFLDSNCHLQTITGILASSPFLNNKAARPTDTTLHYTCYGHLKDILVNTPKQDINTQQAHPGAIGNEKEWGKVPMYRVQQLIITKRFRRYVAYTNLLMESH